MPLVRCADPAAKRFARLALFAAAVAAATWHSPLVLAATSSTPSSTPTDTTQTALSGSNDDLVQIPKPLSPTITVALDAHIPAAAMRDSIKPQYPEQARQRGVEGYVVVQFDITREGNVTGAHVIEAQPENCFENAAIDAVKQYRFAPNDVAKEDIAIRGAVNRFVFSLKENSGAYQPYYVPYRGRSYFAALTY